MKAMLAGVVAAILSVFGGHQAITDSASNAAAAAAVSTSPSALVVAKSSATQPPSTSTPPTIVNQPVIERIIERTIQSAAAPSTGYVSESEFTTKLNELSDSFGRIISGSSYPASASTLGSGGVWNAIALSNRIDQLTNTTITNATVHGLSGLTAADIPTDITAAYYLPLVGGTMTGTLNVPTINASSTTYTSFTATNSTTTNFFATNASTTNATSTNLFASFGHFTTGIIDSLTAAAATITNLIVTSITGTNATFTNATTTNATSTNAFATNFTATNATITNATTTNFFSTDASTTNATSTNLFASSFSTGNVWAPLQSQNRYVLRSTVTKIAAMKTTPPTQLRLLEFGDSVAGHHASAVVAGLRDSLGDAGVMLSCTGTIATGQAASCLTTNSTSGDVHVVDGTSYAYDYTNSPTGGYFDIGPGGCVTFGAGGGSQLATKMSLFYVAEPGAGTLTLNTNKNAAGWLAGLSVSAANASRIGGVLATTTSDTGPYQMQACVSGSGRVKVFSGGFENTSINGVVVIVLARGGLALNDANSTPTAITGPWYAALNPDLVTFEMKESSIEPNGTTYLSNLQTFVSNWKSANPYADFLLIGSPPVGPTFSDADQIAQNTSLRQVAAANNAVYWDGYYSALDYNTEKALGWITDGSTPHQTTLGQAAESNLLWSSLGLGSLINATSTQNINNAMTQTANLLAVNNTSATASAIASIINNNSAGGGGLYISQATGGSSFFPLRVDTNYQGSSNSLVVTSQGNLGIGSTTANSMLTLSRAGGASMWLDNPSSGSSRITFSSGNDALALHAFIDYPASSFFTFNAGRNDISGFQFQTNAGGSAQPRMTITNAGNVGIGTTSPYAKFSISANSGDTNTTLFSIAGSIAAATTTLFSVSNTGTLTLGDNQAQTQNASVVFNIGQGSANPNISAYKTNSGNVELLFKGANNTVFGIDDGGPSVAAGVPLQFASVNYSSPNYDTFIMRGGTATVQLGAADVASPIAQTLQVQSVTAGTSNTAGANFIISGSKGTGAGVGGSILFRTAPAGITGTSQNALITAFAITGTGNVGIGTTSPYAKLSISANNSDTNTTLFAIASSTASATTTLFSVANTGNVTITGSAATCTLGNGASATNCSSSDQRLKDDITTIQASSSLAAIESLRPVSFLWNQWMVGNGAATSTQFGFIAQEIMHTFPNLVTMDTNSHYYKLDYQGLFAPIVGAVQALAQKVTDFADSFTTKELTFTRATGDEIDAKKLCLQKSDGTNVCVTGDQLAAALGGTNAGGGASNTTPTPDTTPPVITINGDNPAHINIGDTYADLGATVADNVDQNLGLKYFLKGTLVSNIVIDTSAAATDIIDYVATDNAGNIATSTRTVIVEAASSTPPSSSAATTSAATSTSQ